MAAIGRRRRKVSGHSKRRKAPHRKQVVVVGRRRRRAASSSRPAARRRRVSGIGSTGIGRARTRRRKRSIMGFSSGGKFMQIAEMAVGVGVGAVGTHMLLRPLEHKLSEHMPAAAKFMGAAEIVLGGFIALKSTKPFIKSVGIGILAGGVHVVMKQLPIGMHSPAEAHIAGMDDMTRLNVPINGNLRSAIAGLIDNSGTRYIKTPTVAGNIVRNDRGPTRTPTVGDMEYSPATVGEETGSELSEEERAFLYQPRGM